jgi:RND family efflux transporter MFP subunit
MDHTLSPLFFRAAVVAGACALAGCNRGEAQAEGVAASATPVAVDTAAVREAPVPVTMTLTGSLRPDREARLAASGAGRVMKVHFDRGTEVKEGQLLAELDVSSASISAAEARKAAEAAKLQRETSKRECERAKTLFESGAIAKSELDMRKAQCDAAEIGVETAGLRAALGANALRDGAVRAPFVGVIEDRTTDVGEYLMPGSPVATLVKLDRLKLDIMVPEAQLAHVAKDTPVSFRVAAYGDRRFTARVGVVGATVRQGTRDVLVEAEVDNADRALKPGMFATVEIVTSQAPSPVVPKAAVVKRGDASHLFVVVDGRAHERVVKLGPAGETDVAVLRGASVGEIVVASPPETLVNGAPIKKGE